MKEEKLKSMCRVNGSYILSSSLVTSEYYDLADLYCQNPRLVIAHFRERITEEFDCVASIELGGALIAAGLGAAYNVPIAIWRKNRPLLGIPVGRVLVIDDVKTTGNSIDIVEKWVNTCDAEITEVIVGIDRSDEVEGMTTLSKYSQGFKILKELNDTEKAIEKVCDPETVKKIVEEKLKLRTE